MLACLGIEPLCGETVVDETDARIFEDVFLWINSLWTYFVIEINHDIVRFQVIINEAALVNELQDIQQFQAQMEYAHIV